jgi:hypothetical protein
MADTFEQTWRLARLAFPGVPALLVRDWVQDAFTKACRYRGGSWGFLRTEASINTLASRSIATTLTQGSTAITSAALFVASDAGRQLKASGTSYPIYTIASVTDASNAILDRPYAASVTNPTTVAIFDAYFTTPADFGHFLIIYDPYNQRILPFWFSQDQIGVADPARTNSDTGPRYLVAQGYSTATATLGQVRYEFWPTTTSARQFPYVYYKQSIRLADSDSFPGVFGNSGDLFKLGAKIEAALYPGTRDQKNPYYNLALADRLEKQWAIELQRLSLADDTQYPEDQMMVDWAARYGPMTAPTSLLRSTDATLNDYY